MERIGLVLEGGGMRGAYTAGVLDAFLDKELRFKYIIGVSAGANNGINYAARQRDRSKRIFLHWSQDKRFIGSYNLLKERSIFGMNFLFDQLPNELDHFDYPTFKETNATFIACASNCETGKATYFNSSDFGPKEFMNKPMRASSSLPMLSPAVTIDNQRYLDGVLADPIPIKKSINDGHPYNVVVLTKEEATGKKLSLLDHVFISMTRVRYPKLSKTVKASRAKYLNTLSHMRELEASGDVFVFAPKEAYLDSRYCNDKDCLEKAYNHGYESVYEKWDTFSAWISNITEQPMPENINS